jgi:hypothetical protein
MFESVSTVAIYPSRVERKSIHDLYFSRTRDVDIVSIEWVRDVDIVSIELYFSYEIF